MKCGCLTGKNKVGIIDVTRPDTGNDKIIVRVESCGICGSEIHYYRQGRIGNSYCEYPHFMGHEPAGAVEEAPPQSHFKKGDRVAVEPGLSCFECEYCMGGRINICPNVEFLGTPGTPGGFAEYIAVDEKQLEELPESLSYDEGAMLEPLGIAYHAIVNLAKVEKGESIAVFGAGTIGLLSLKTAEIYGCGKSFISDPLDYRLDFASKHAGADFTVNPEKDRVVESILDMTGGRGVDISIDAAGTQQSIEHCFTCARNGGKALLAGIPETDSISYDPHCMRRKELQILNVRRSNGTLKECIGIAAEKKINLAPFITHRFKLDDIEKAFDTVGNYKDNVIRAVITP